jgi:hypothetical protein
MAVPFTRLVIKRILNGRLLDRKALDRMLEAVEKVAAK